MRERKLLQHLLVFAVSAIALAGCSDDYVWQGERVSALIDKAEHGDAIALHALGNLIVHKGTTDRSWSTKKVVKWFRSAGRQGNDEAQWYLGLMCSRGKPNIEEAVKWYQMAADQGHAKAQNNLGRMYSMGRGVPADVQKAIELLTSSAQQGNGAAQCHLGLLYYGGIVFGVVQDYETSVYWTRKAAEQNNAPAQSNLGLAYEKGRGVEKDLSEAYMWYQLASDNIYTQDTRDRRYKLGERLGPELMFEAIRRAKEWKPKTK
jgi:TPR repeat protein